MATTSSIQDILMMYTWEDDVETNATQEIVEHGRPKLFDFPYPLYDSKMKDQFEEDFIRHFYTREIGSESIALFKLRLQDYLYLNSEKWERLYKSMDDTLNPFNNIDLQTIRSTDESETSDKDVSEDETQLNKRDQTTSENEEQTNTKNKENTENMTQTKTTTSDEQEDGTNNQQTTVDTHADDFTRNLESETPDERLQITAQDGVGVIDYASNIGESKNVNDSTQESNVSGSTGRTVAGTESEEGNQDRSGTETDNEQKNRTTTGTANESEDRNRNRTELEKQLRAFEQALDEHKVGRHTSQSFVELYDEYIQQFQGLHRLMFKDMEKLFLGVF